MKRLLEYKKNTWEELYNHLKANDGNMITSLNFSTGIVSRLSKPTKLNWRKSNTLSSNYIHIFVGSIMFEFSKFDMSDIEIRTKTVYFSVDNYDCHITLK